MSSKILIKSYMSKKEKDAVTSYAKRRGETASALLRKLALEEINYEGEDGDFKVPE